MEFIKKLVSIVTTFIKENGVTGLGGLGVGLYFIASSPLIAGIGFGVFGTRNWDLIVFLIQKYIMGKDVTLG